PPLETSPSQVKAPNVTHLHLSSKSFLRKTSKKGKKENTGNSAEKPSSTALYGKLITHSRFQKIPAGIRVLHPAATKKKMDIARGFLHQQCPLII
ncbi:MAG: hypothetical protein ACP5R6_01700, partial [Chlorobaculum sp.]